MRRHPATPRFPARPTLRPSSRRQPRPLPPLDPHHTPAGCRPGLWGERTPARPSPALRMRLTSSATAANPERKRPTACAAPLIYPSRGRGLGDTSPLPAAPQPRPGTERPLPRRGCAGHVRPERDPARSDSGERGPWPVAHSGPAMC